MKIVNKNGVWELPKSSSLSLLNFLRLRSFISAARPTVHKNRHENGAFRRRSSKPEDLKTPAFRSRVDGKLFGNGGFGCTIMWPDRVFLKHMYKSKLRGDSCVFKFLHLIVWGENSPGVTRTGSKCWPTCSMLQYARAEHILNVLSYSNPGNKEATLRKLQ